VAFEVATGADQRVWADLQGDFEGAGCLLEIEDLSAEQRACFGKGSETFWSI